MRMTTMHWEKNDIISVSQQLTVCGGLKWRCLDFEGSRRMKKYIN